MFWFSRVNSYLFYFILSKIKRNESELTSACTMFVRWFRNSSTNPKMSINSSSSSWALTLSNCRNNLSIAMKVPVLPTPALEIKTRKINTSSLNLYYAIWHTWAVLDLSTFFYTRESIEFLKFFDRFIRFDYFEKMSVRESVCPVGVVCDTNFVAS